MITNKAVARRIESVQEILTAYQAGELEKPDHAETWLRQLEELIREVIPH